MQAALKRAKLDADQIDYVNAHGTSTHGRRDRARRGEADFGDDAYKLSMSSTKSATGHLLGAAGAIEAIYSIKSIIEQAVPPTLNLDEPDEGLRHRPRGQAGQAAQGPLRAQQLVRLRRHQRLVDLRPRLIVGG